jgi:ABC-type phosphate/phosphonate transport system substrate-binding protein
MYDPPELRRRVDSWWKGLAGAFRRCGIPDVPDRLDRDIAFDALWSAPDLLFAQACGYPLIGKWAGRLQYVATPRYAAPGCEGVRYCSWVVVSADSPARCIEDLRGSRCSINGRISHSGYNALRALVAPLASGGRFFGSVSVSGSHFESLLQIQRGEADVASIDCISHELFARCRPDVLASARIVGRTADAPGLPYVTRCPADPDLIQRMRAGLELAFADPGLSAVRDDLLIAGLDVLCVDDYRCMAEMEADALRRRYFELE